MGNAKKRNRPRIIRLRKQEEEYWRKNKILDNLVKILFFLGLILLIWEVNIFRATVINWIIPTLICLVPPIFSTPILFNKLNEIDPSIYLYSKYKAVHYFIHYCLHFVIIGGILCFSFMAINYYFADNQVTLKRFEIIEKGQFNSRNRDNWVRIDYEGTEKELVFPNSYSKDIESAKYVSFEISKGFLGFDIIKSKNLE